MHSSSEALATEAHVINARKNKMRMSFIGLDRVQTSAGVRRRRYYDRLLDAFVWKEGAAETAPLRLRIDHTARLKVVPFPITLFCLRLPPARILSRTGLGPRLLPSPSWLRRLFWRGLRHASRVFRRGPSRCRAVREKPCRRRHPCSRRCG